MHATAGKRQRLLRLLVLGAAARARADDAGGFSYEGDITDPTALEHLGLASACGRATVSDLSSWPGRTQMSLIFPDWQEGGEVVADLGPGFEGVESCAGPVHGVHEKWGSLDGGVKKKLLTFRMGKRPDASEEEGVDDSVRVQCIALGTIEEWAVSRDRMKSRITYPGSSCSSHISPPPPPPPPEAPANELESPGAEGEQVHKRIEDHWGACAEEDYKCAAPQNTKSVHKARRLLCVHIQS